MENRKIVNKYFNKYFKQQYFTEDDHEFKALVRILNKKDKQVKNIEHDALLEVPLPDFLYKDSLDNICIGQHGDAVVTDEWNKWKEDNGF